MPLFSNHQIYCVFISERFFSQPAQVALIDLGLVGDDVFPRKILFALDIHPVPFYSASPSTQLIHITANVNSRRFCQYPRAYFKWSLNNFARKVERLFKIQITARALETWSANSSEKATKNCSKIDEKYQNFLAAPKIQKKKIEKTCSSKLIVFPLFRYVKFPIHKFNFMNSTQSY